MGQIGITWDIGILAVDRQQRRLTLFSIRYPASFQGQPAIGCHRPGQGLPGGSLDATVKEREQPSVVDMGARDDVQTTVIGQTWQNMNMKFQKAE